MRRRETADPQTTAAESSTHFGAGLGSSRISPVTPQLGQGSVPKSPSLAAAAVQSRPAVAMPYAMQHGPFGPIMPPLEAVDSMAVQRPGLVPPATSEPVAGARGERSGKKRIPCAFYLKTGNCAFGNECKFEHPLDQPATQYNSLGLPLRPGEPDCAYYVRNLHCGYGASCKFHHAEPMVGWMPVQMAEGLAMPVGMQMAPVMPYGAAVGGSPPSAGSMGGFPMSPMMQPMAHQMVAQQQLGSQMLPQGMATQLMSPQMASQLMPQQLAPQMVPQQMAPQQMAAASQMAARQMVPQMVPQLGQHMQQQLAPSQLSGQLSMSTPMYSGYFQRATTPMFPVNPFFQARNDMRPPEHQPMTASDSSAGTVRLQESRTRRRTRGTRSSSGTNIPGPRDLGSLASMEHASEKSDESAESKARSEGRRHAPASRGEGQPKAGAGSSQSLSEDLAKLDLEKEAEK